MNNWRSLAWRMAAAFLLLLLLGGPTLLLLFTLASPGPGRATRVQAPWDWRSLLAAETGFSRAVVLSVEPGRLTADFSGTFESSGPVAQRILEGGLEDDTALRAFLSAAFGTLELEDGVFQKARYARPRWEVVPQSHALHVQLQATVPVGATVSGALRRAPDATPGLVRDEFRLNHPGGRRLRFLPAPDETSNEHALLAPLPHPSPSITFGVELPSSPATRSRHLLWSYGGISDVALLYDILKGLGRALPFLLFLTFTRERPQEKKERMALEVLRPFTLSVVYFIVLLWCLTGLLKGLYAWAPMQELSTRIEAWGLGHFGTVPLSPLLPRAISGLFPALIGVILPGFLLGRLHEVAKPDTRAVPVWRRMLPGMAIGALCLGVAVPVSSRLSGQSSALWTAGALLLSWVLISAVLAVLEVRTFRATTALAATGILALTVGLMVLPAQAAPAWTSTAWKLLDTGLTTALLLVLVMAFRHFTAAASGTTPSRLSVRAMVGTVLACLLLAYPQAEPRWVFSEHDLLSFVVPFAPVLGWCWLGGCVWLLFMHAQGSQRISAMPRAVGLLAIAAILYGYNSPVSGGRLLTFLLGWALLARVVVRPSSGWEALRRLHEAAGRERAELVQKLLDLNALESAYVRFRQKGRERLDSGELTFDTYQKNNQTAWRQLTAARAEAVIEGRPAREAVLAFGPEATAWGNGLRGASFGLLFALPWILIAAWSLFEQPRSPEPYPFWVLAQGLGSVLLHWTLVGFLFGYFFPYIRGASGLTKSFWVFLALTVPFSLIALSKLSSAEHARALALWLTQTLIQIFSLGLFAFDQATLRKNGFRSWRLLFEVHDLPMVSLSLSSLVVAFGVALTTVLQSSAPKLVELALTVLLPASTQLFPSP